MDKHLITEKIEDIYKFFQSKESALLAEIQQHEQQLEMLSADIAEKETYRAIEDDKRRQASNIFNLYDTTNQYEEKQKKLDAKLQKLYEKKQERSRRQQLAQKELELVKRHSDSAALVVQYMKETQEDRKEQKPKNEEKETLINRLQFCLSILDLDKERCAVELRSILDEISD